MAQLTVKESFYVAKWTLLGSTAQEGQLSACLHEFGDLQMMLAVGSKTKNNRQKIYSLDPQRPNKSSEFSALLCITVCNEYNQLNLL